MLRQLFSHNVVVKKCDSKTIKILSQQIDLNFFKQLLPCKTYSLERICILIYS